MSKFIKIIISLILVLSMCIPFSAVVFADSYTSSITSFWDQYVYNQQKSADQGATVDGLAAYVISSGVQGIYHNDSVCQNTDSGLHESTNTTSLGSGTDDYGAYYILQCDYCNSSFRCYSSDLALAYESYRSAAPANVYVSDGSLMYQSTWEDYYLSSYSESMFMGYCFYGFTLFDYNTDFESLMDELPLEKSFLVAKSFKVSLEIVSTGILASSLPHSYAYTNVVSYYMGGYSNGGLFFKAPLTGDYSSSSLKFSSSNVDGDLLSSEYYDISSQSLSEGASLLVFGNTANETIGRDNTFYYSEVYSSFYLPVFKVTLSSSDTLLSNKFYIDASRPTYNITYNLATTTTSGDYTVINNVYENQTIINEGDNIYTDIKTGNEYEIEGWEFDYTKRKYTCNLVDGSLLEVTFGDAYVTVELNGETEYYYYVSEDEDGSVSDCNHTFSVAEDVAATCLTDGHKVSVCTQCGVLSEETYFATGHDYQFLWTVLDTYEVDTSTLVCPGCNGTDITCTQVDNTENFTCVCNSADCAQTWTVVGSTIAGYDLYQCINCQEFYNDYTHEGVDRSDAGYWSWLQTWLQNFKTWLGEKLDALINKEVAVGGGDTINNEEVNNFYDQSDTNINTDADIDYAISYTNEDGTEQETSLKGIIAKFAFIKDIWKIGQTLISVVSEDAAYAYEFDPTIGNEATTDTGTEAATVSVEEEADTLLSSGSGAPSIPLNLGAAQSVYGFNYGGEVEMLDLSWYTPYKETVDKLVGGFLWLFFMWKLFQRAPDIISGAGMDSYKQEDLSAGNKLSRRRVKTNWRSRP